MSVTLRRASAGDVDFVVELANHDDVEPFLGARRARDHAAILREVERSQREPAAFGRMIVECDGERAGMMGYERVNERSRIAQLEGIAVHPDFRGRRLADDAARALQRYLIFELGFHRLQLEVYAFNERALVHAERSGFVREGVKRKAYWRHGEWVDAVLFALIREDLDDDPRQRGEERMELIHTCYRITDIDRSVGFYEALGFEERGRFPIRDEAINVFMGLPGDDNRLELTYNFGVDSYEIGTGYGHIAVTVDDLDATLERLAEQGIEPERPPYRIREGGSRLCFVRDPDGYRIELIERSAS